jgi:hypothetical protein
MMISLFLVIMVFVYVDHFENRFNNINLIRHETLNESLQPVESIGFGIYHDDQLIKVTKLINSIDYPVKFVYIIDQRNNYSKISLTNEKIKKIKQIKVPFNLGCASVWNLLISLCDEYILLMGYDTIFYSTSLSNLMIHINGILKTQYIASFSVDSAVSSFVGFYIKKEIINVVGWFDDNIWPANYEDNDYIERLNKYNLQMIHLDDVKISHAAHSGLLIDQRLAMLVNEEYFKNKHKMIEPFNLSRRIELMGLFR